MAPTHSPTFRPFRVEVPQADLDDLHERLLRTRLPNQPEGIGWEQGTDLRELERLLAVWRDTFDWRAAEARLNRFDHVLTEVDGQRFHALHQRSPHPGALPLVLVHGWPGSVVEFLEVIGPLVDPPDPADAFHVIAPSLPGYGFSGPTTAPGWHPRKVAGALAEVVAGLGYDRWGAQGGDWGSIVTQHMADLEPERVLGLHLNFLSLPRPKDRDDDDLTEEERAVLDERRRWETDGNAYQQLQGTRPQTIGYALDDSPVGLLAWIVEKFRSWSDCDGDLSRAFTDDQLLTNVSLYWLTRTATSSARMYWELRNAGVDAVPRRPVTVPTGVAVFPGEIAHTPRAWAERRYRITRWTEMPRGGHFAAMEQPELLVDDVRAFFRPLRSEG